MAIDILVSEKGSACLYCNTSNWAFGPIFDSVDDAAGFLQWASDKGLPEPRTWDDPTFRGHYSDWIKEDRPRAICRECDGRLWDLEDPTIRTSIERWFHGRCWTE